MALGEVLKALVTWAPPVASAAKSVWETLTKSKPKTPDPAVAEAQRHAVESGAARNRESKITSSRASESPREKSH